MHVFMVQLRDEHHKLLPGVEAGDVGVKMGDNAIDTGYLRLKVCAIPFLLHACACSPRFAYVCPCACRCVCDLSIASLHLTGDLRSLHIVCCCVAMTECASSSSAHVDQAPACGGRRHVCSPWWRFRRVQQGPLPHDDAGTVLICTPSLSSFPRLVIAVELFPSVPLSFRPLHHVCCFSRVSRFS